MLAYFVPSRRSLTRRALLVGTATLAGCARHKSRGFPGYAFVANAGARTVAAVDLNAFALAKQISLDSAPGAVLSNPLRPGVYVLMPESGAVCEIDATKLVFAAALAAGLPLGFLLRRSILSLAGRYVGLPPLATWSFRAVLESAYKETA